MNLIEALKTFRGIRRPTWAPDYYRYPDKNGYFESLVREDMVADDWEVEPTTEVCSHAMVNYSQTNVSPGIWKCQICGAERVMPDVSGPIERVFGEECKHNFIAPNGDYKCQHCGVGYKETFPIKPTKPRLLAWRDSAGYIQMIDECCGPVGDYTRVPHLDEPETEIRIPEKPKVQPWP